MKKTISNRFLSILLAVLLAFTAVPSFAYAAEGDFTHVSIERLYGRNALGKMEKGQKYLKAYDAIKAGLEEYQSSISLSKYGLNKQELSDIFYIVLNDNPQIFWARMDYSFTFTNSKVTSVTPKYVFKRSELADAKQKYNSAVSNILEGVSPAMSDFEIECYLHDIICQNVNYSLQSDYGHVSYGALVDGYAVCEGYTRALQDLLLRCGIEAYAVPGLSSYPGTSVNENHIWLIVNIGGEWYHLDVTWDDQTNSTYHAYFNLTTEQILKDHIIFEEVVPITVCTGTDYGMEAYFASRGTYIEAYDTVTVANAFVKGNGKASFYYAGTGTVDDFYNMVWKDRYNINNILGWEYINESTAYHVGKEIIIILGNKQDADAEASTDNTETETTETTESTESTDEDANKTIINGIKNTKLTLSAVTGSGYIKLSWKKQGKFKVDKYYIYRSLKKSSGYKKLGTTQKTTYKVTKNLTKGKKYYFKVRGMRVIGETNYFTGYSNIVCKTAK